MKKNFRPLLSLTLALALVNLFTMGSLAYAPVISGGEKAPARDVVVSPQQPGTGNSGILNCKGHTTINGNDARTGSTVLSGNTVATGGGSYAAIEMGPALGRIELKSDTTVMSTFAPGLIMDDFIQCGHMTETVPPGVTVVVHDTHSDRAKVIVKIGQVLVKYSDNKEKTLKAGDSETFDRLNEVDTTGACVFTIECGHHIAGLWWLGGGLLGLAGLGAGLALTVFNGGGSNGTPVLSSATP